MTQTSQVGASCFNPEHCLNIYTASRPWAVMLNRFPAAHAAAALEAMHIPQGTIRVLFKTLNTKK